MGEKTSAKTNKQKTAGCRRARDKTKDYHHPKNKRSRERPIKTEPRQARTKTTKTEQGKDKTTTIQDPNVQRLKDKIPKTLP